MFLSIITDVNPHTQQSLFQKKSYQEYILLHKYDGYTGTFIVKK